MRVFAFAFLALLAVAGTSETRAQPSDPFEFYNGYLAVLAKAKSLDELLPYYSRELADSLAQMPREMQANYLKMKAQVLTGLKVTKKTAGPGRTVLGMTAKTADGRDTTGSATLVKEGGSWKVEDEKRAAALPKTGDA